MNLSLPRRKSRRERMMQELPKRMRESAKHPTRSVRGGAAAVGGVVGLALGSAAVSARRRRPDRES